MKNLKITVPLFLVLTILFVSCDKKYLEIVPVMQVEQDLSIAGAKDIKYFSFPTQLVGYAAENEAYIYKTTDSGKTWSKLAVGSGGKCQGLEFFDPLNGMCLMGKNVYVTANGGQTWTLQDFGQFIGITADGKGVIGNCTYLSCGVQVSSDQGKTFRYLGNVALEGEFQQAFIAGSKVFIAGNRGDESFLGINTDTKAKEELIFGHMTYDEKPTSLLINEYSSVLVGTKGQILEPGSYESYRRVYYGHTYSYFAVDGYQGTVVAAGERTVSVNQDFGEEGRWSELLDRNGKSFSQTFYKIRFINQNSFYISGSNGLLWRARI